MAKITLQGMYNLDNSIFDKCVFPDSIDREVVLEGMLQEGQGREVFYPDPDAIKHALGNFTARRLYSWSRMADALQAEYSPIENFDRYEDYLDSGSGSQSSTGKNKDNTYANAYNSGVDTKTGSADSTTSGDSNNSYQSSHVGHLHGNIGVTTNQQMITAEMEMRKIDIYDTIIGECLDEITLYLFY